MPAVVRPDDLQLSQVPSSDGPATQIRSAPELGRGVVLVGRYEVERVLGEGGMGVVVAAQDRASGRRVALKFLQPDASRDEGVRARFQREAQAASAIASEHVVRVFDVGTLASGSPFIAMELLEGEDLAQSLDRRGPLPVDEAVDHVLEALVAIGLAHLRGIAHRDLKPANLFLTRRPDGRPIVKVLDFGLSKSAPGAENLALTKTGHAAMGTPLYMAPEQIRSLKAASFASDVWAVGVILFELTTNRPPFDGESLGALFAAISADPPLRLESVLPTAPRALGDAIQRCLAKKPAERPGAVELAGWLVPFAGQRGRDAFARLQEDATAAGGAPAVGAAPVDEPSFTPDPILPRAGFADSAGVPTRQLDISGLGTPPPIAAPDRRTSSPAPPGRGGATVAAVAIALSAALGATAWWLTRSQVTAGSTTAVPSEPSSGPAPTAAEPVVTPTQEAPPPASAEAASSAGPAPAASSAAAPAASTIPSAAVPPRPPPRPRPPPPPASARSLDEVIKKGRR